MSYYVTSHDLRSSITETGDGQQHVGPWVPAREFIEGDVFVEVAAIDGTLQLELQTASRDQSIIAALNVPMTSMSAPGTQFAHVGAPASWVRLAYTITNGATATWRAVFDGRGLA